MREQYGFPPVSGGYFPYPPVPAKFLRFRSLVGSTPVASTTFIFSNL